MDHIPEQDLPTVGEAAHAVFHEAKRAGVQRQETSIDAANRFRLFLHNIR